MAPVAMMPPDPFTLGIIAVVLACGWWIWIGARPKSAHVLEVIVIIAMFVGGIGLYLGTAALYILRGGH